MNKHFFCIADHHVCIEFQPSSANSMQLLSSFKSFEEKETSQNLLLEFVVDDSIRPKKERQLVRKFETGNGDTLVYLLPGGGYQFIIRDILGRDCALLISNESFNFCRCALNGDVGMRSFGLNDAFMLAYSFAACHFHTVLVHASCVFKNGKGYPFIAKSGTGKSTHTSLWMSYLDGVELLNDDNPIVRVIDDNVYIYGSPWSGKTPCYRNHRVPLGAITRIERDCSNHLERLSPTPAFASLLPSCSSMKWDDTLYGALCDTITSIIERVPSYVMHCLPDKDAAIVCYKSLCK